MMSKTIILNAPPNSGKDTIAIALCHATGAMHHEFKDHLYFITAALFAMNPTAFKVLATHRENKEKQTQQLVLPISEYNRLCSITGRKEVRGVSVNSQHAISPREAMIYVSELVVKPTFGSSHFGKIANKHIEEGGAVFSDGGFEAELDPILRGQEEVYIVRFTRGDNNFDGDSRGWFAPRAGVPMLNTTNDGTVEEIVQEILEFIGEG